MTDSIIRQQKTRSKRRKSSAVNSRNVRAKSEEEKVKRSGSAWIWFYDNIDGGNDLNTIGEKDLMVHSEKLPFIKINNDKKAMYKEYKEKLPQGVLEDTICPRMSVIGAYDVISKLTEEQKDSVRLIGLDGILELRPFKICRELCLYLVNEFDCDTRMLNINGRKISVGPSDISHVLGLKDHGFRVSTCAPSDDTTIDSNYLKLNKLKDDLLNMEDVDEQFKRKFALYTFGVFFCPAVKPEVDKGFLSIVTYINKLAEINLAHLVFDCLVQGIRERQQTKNMYVRGCLAFFMVSIIYILSPYFKSFTNY
ncbi:hypothetical protein ACJIZ3_023498 [Penstemon smallii]|uniref:Uncharacterized protein n=1 Tax=Penstemon smallii TaxID=265156 RepID=A0ABD3TP89_9LAMI